MYRKFTARRIFNGYQFIDDQRVLITDEKGTIKDWVTEEDAGDGIEHLNGILTPGFTNAHCHVELSHLKGQIPQKTGLVEFVKQVIRKRETGKEEKEEAMRRALEEMENNGIVAIGDICNSADSLPVKENSKLYWHHFIELTGFVDATAEKRLDQAVQLQNHFFTQLPEQPATLSPHAPYSVSEKLFRLINENTGGEVISIHNQESAEENKLYLDGTGNFLSLYADLGIDIQGFKPTGKSSLQSWLPYFNKRQKIILVHNTFTDENDLAFAISNFQASTPNLFFCLCPNANRYIENQLPPIELLRRHRLQIVLGTDSLASNEQLSILEEIRMLTADDSTSLEEALQWATSNGARALGLDDQLGSFDKGKSPGLVLIDETDGYSLSTFSKAKRLL